MHDPIRALFVTLALTAGMACAALPAAAEDGPPAADARASADLPERLADKSDSVRLAAAREAAAVQDTKLLKPLTKLLRDDQFDIRNAAMTALGRRASAADRKAAAKALNARLAPLARSPDHEGELILVAGALHDLAQPSSVKALIDVLTAKTSDEVSAACLNAVANVPTPAAIEALIGHLAKGRRKGAGRQRQNTEKALRYATGEKLRSDPDVWRRWWKENAKSFDFEAAAERREATVAKQARKKDRKDRKGRKGKQDKDDGAE